MKTDIKKRWLKALRSGKYRQTRGKLKSRNGSFCCLGVLCDIQDAQWEWDGIMYGVLGNVALPPEKFCAGIQSLGELSELNDGTSGHKKHSFSQIADYIEKNL